MEETPLESESGPPAIGRYRPLLKLGTGGMADVYLAVSRTASGLEKLAVIKRLRTDLGDDPDEIAHFKGMFWDEAKLAMLLNHSNVVHTHDACEEGNTLYIVMEYIEGQSLNNVQRELARRQRHLTPIQAALIVSEVLAGLHYAHELKGLNGDHLNIVHRDVSPQNILLGYDGNIKIVDFGVAQSTTRSTETRAGMLKGKARYMAPEQVINKKGKLDRRADIYSAGVVLWELIARRKLVEGSNMVEQLVNVIKLEPERLSAVVPNVDPELEAIVHRALSREPNNRYDTALGMREALLAYARRNGDLRVAEIGSLVADVFARKRHEITAIISERLRSDSERERRGELLSVPTLLVMDNPSERSLPSASTSTTRAAMLGSGSVSVSSVTPHGLVQPATSGMPPAQRSKNALSALLVVALLASLVVVGGLAGVVVSMRSRPTPIAATALPPSPPAKEAAPPPATPIPPAAAKHQRGEPRADETASPETTAAGVATGPALGVRVTRGGAPQPVAPALPPQRGHSPSPSPGAPAARAPDEGGGDGGGGFLTLDTYPWTKVSENGRDLGNTPLVRLPMSVGTHNLVLENPADGVRQTTTVVVKAGETVSKRLAF